MTTHAEAKAYASDAFMYIFARPPTLTERQVLCGVGRLETGYGDWWKGDGVGSNNIGAVQATRPPCNPATSFQYTDTHPNDDGTSTTYKICFKRYATPQLGWTDLVKILYGNPLKPKAALAAATAGDLYGVSAAMHAAHYYEGVGATVADRINNHFKALSAAVKAASTALSEPYPGAPSMIIPPTIRRGARGETVKTWQRILNTADTELAVDGMFGPHTEAETRKWQTRHGLVSDGVVGVKTWTAALTKQGSTP